MCTLFSLQHLKVSCIYMASYSSLFPKNKESILHNRNF